MKKIFFLGPIGSYSHIVTKKAFPDEELISCNTFFEIANKIKSNTGSIGVLPIENSITSDVHENVDYIFKNPDFSIIGESVLRINLHLYGLQGSTLSDIKIVYSHPKALAQSTKFIDNHNLEMRESKSTAEAKEIIIDQKNMNQACIGSSDLKDNQIVLLQSNIGNAKNNFTRFIFVTAKPKALHHHADKATFIFKVKHEPGTLTKVLSQLAAKGLNLTKIESRPLPNTYWEYQFWIDLEIPKNIQLNDVENIIKSSTLSCRLVGAYVKGKVFES